jgi:SAM-dependent methyltransferase
VRSASDEGDARDWDGFYVGDGSDTAHWSGQPNPTLVTETAPLPPGRALDVGCGEGADAIWLAAHGWQVTALDPSTVALGRARAAAHAAGAAVTWIGAGLLELEHGDLAYDLVSAHYAVVRRGDRDAALEALLRAVAPGGTLLVVHHEREQRHPAEHGVDPSDHLMPDGLLALLHDDWRVQAFEARGRSRGQDTRPGPRDIVLRAQRRYARP